MDQPLSHRENTGVRRDIVCYSNAGIWSHITFRWLNPLFEKGQREKKLKLSHIPLVPELETTEKAFSKLQESMQILVITSLPRAIAHATWKPLAINAAIAGIYAVSSYMGPFLITHSVNSLSVNNDDASSYNHGLIIAFIFFIAKNMESVSQRQWYFGAQRVSVRIRAALMVLIYKKSSSIKLSQSGPINWRIVSLINADIEKIGELCLQVHQVWLLTVQVFLALIILYRSLGAAPSMVALFTTVLVMVCNTPLANRQKRYHSKIMEAMDSRIKATSETFKNMRVLKLHSWESSFLKKLLGLRRTQFAVAFLFWASPVFVSAATLGVCIALAKTPLTSGTIFPALATFWVLQEPIYNLPEFISMIAQTKVSLDRIREFIQEEDLEMPVNNANNSLKIMKGYKVAICGSVGSGKSSLLCSILGEIPRISGWGIQVYGSKAYVPQSAWIQTGTNVLFGSKMDEELYESVLRACVVNKDVSNWVNGDLILVGERGMKLSGGQKPRIQPARAIYSNSDVYFLDDPFSAVDALTGAHLFQLEFLHAADLVLVMRDIRIVQSGKYGELMEDPQGELVRMMSSHENSLKQVNPVHQIQNHAHMPNQRNGIRERQANSPESLKRTNDHEETQTRRVNWLVYSKFITSAYKGALMPVILSCQVIFQGLQMESNCWITWAVEEPGRVSNGKMLGIFVSLSAGGSIFMLGRTVLLSSIALKTAQNLFVGMITSIFRAPMLFFDLTPSSQILNRSLTDQRIVDTNIPYRLAGLAFALIQLFCIIILMCMVSWQLPFLFLLISVWYQRNSLDGWHALIRCFNWEDDFLTKSLGLIDDYSRIVFHNSATMEWLSVRINFLFNLIFFVVLAILVTL
ncbi:ABC transporter C family member 5 [Camellia lanceoleosa]|uniref:ABC transporter C family member 5 n=1 Tax=Camellia lanceoleosa TaxID=1840588 RepID=A0ACC0IB16_9ERIC|nr:ABC transporter C family member 5 [Camellia lanceoleosa]